VSAPTAEAVLIVDLQIGMMDGARFPPLPDHERLLARARTLIAWARASGRDLLFVRHDGPPGEALAPGAPGWDLHPGLGRRDTETIIAKNVGDAFAETDLADRLRARGVTGVVIAGAQTDECVLATIKGALGHGFAVRVAADAHGTWGYGGKTAAEIIALHNGLYAAAGATVADAADIVAS